MLDVVAMVTDKMWDVVAMATAKMRGVVGTKSPGTPHHPSKQTTGLTFVHLEILEPEFE